MKSLIPALVALNVSGSDSLVRAVQGHDRKWWTIRNKAKDVVDLSIMDEISFWGTSAKEFVSLIGNLDEGTTINLHIYSPGGSIFEGNEIANALANHKGQVNVTCGALCASIATVIAMAGDTIKMVKNGQFMIHDPSTVAWGSSKDLRSAADLIDRLKDGIVASYASRTKKDPTDLAKKMADETWFTAQEALDFGFIDAIVEPDDESPEDVTNRFDLSAFRNCAKIFPRQPRAVAEPPLPPNPKAKDEQGGKESKQQTNNESLHQQYMNRKIRVFANATTLPPQPQHSAVVITRNKRSVRAALAALSAAALLPQGPVIRAFNNTPAPLTPEQQKAVTDEARKLYTAKLERDEAINKMVITVRDRDKKDFTALAEDVKKKDGTLEEFCLAMATSDQFTKVGPVIGSGIEVVGVHGLPKGTPGEAFVSSDAYKAFADAIKNGKKKRFGGDQCQAEMPLWAQDVMRQIFGSGPQNVTTSSGLTSIEKLPGVITLGVRPLMVKDLIAPGATTNTTIRYIREDTFTQGADTVAEGGTKPAASFSFSEVDAGVKKIAAYTKVSDELWADYLAVASVINMRLPYMVERKEEDQLLNGDGTGNNLTGILATAGIQTLALGANTRVDAIYKAMTKVRWGNLALANQGGFEPDAIIMHPLDWETIRLLKDENGQYFGGGPFTGAYGNGAMVQYEMLWGKPVAVTPAIAQGTALIGAFRLGSQYFQRQGLVIESTNTDQDDFIKNLTTIRAETRLALAVYRPIAFCQVTGL